MKKPSFIYIAMLVMFPLQVIAYSQPTIINKIKVTGNTFTSTKVIMGFAREFKEGDTIDVNSLEKLAAAVRRRLLMTTWFYSADVYVVKREADERTSNVIIEVREGYLLRFGGGNAFGSFGKENISGQGVSAVIDAGYNKQTATVSRLYGRYYFVLSAGNTPFAYTDIDLSKKDRQIVGGSGEIGINRPYDVKIGLHCDADKLYTDDYHALDDFGKLSLIVKRDSRDDFFSSARGSYFACQAGYFSGPKLSFASFDARLYRSLWGETFKWAGQAKFEGIKGVVHDGFFYPSLLGIEGIRAPAAAGMQGNNAFQLVNELRIRLFKETALGFFSIAAEPALFFAAGCAGNSGGSFSLGNNYRYAYGMAARLFFYEPIFVPIRLEFGWNESGENAVFFSVSKPF